MRAEEFADWLAGRGYAASGIPSDIARMRRLEKAMPDFGLPDQDLDSAFRRDRLAGVLSSLEQAIRDLPGRTPPEALVPRSENYGERLRTALVCAQGYKSFCEDAEDLSSQQTLDLKFDARLLSSLKGKFLELHPDFRTFSDCPSFAAGEGEYKRELVRRAASLLDELEGADDAALGTALFELATKRPSNLIDWRAAGMVEEVRAAQPGLVDRAIGHLAREPDDTVAVNDFVEQVWPAFIAGRTSKPYAESRMVPTMIRALLRPDSMFGIHSTPTANAFAMLCGRPLFANGPLSPHALDNTLAMAKALREVMASEWGWSPRDLWDVQGFIWETCQKQHAATSDDQEPIADPAKENRMSEPVNLILYGPPGTGKTYATAREAVALCDGAANHPETPAGRQALMARYGELVRDKRIAFVTFHQSMGYEDFVEGLRPETSGEDEFGVPQAGFRLEPKPGIFREIALLAEEASAHGGDAAPFNLGSRSVYKMSLGRAGIEDHIFEEAIDTGYAMLGWGGEIDWEDYPTYEAIHERWNRDHPGTNGNDGNISMVFAFRAGMADGDVIVVSQGNSLIRAIGEVTGPYEYFVNDATGCNHRRKVKWLKVFDEPIPTSTFYAKPFTQRSCYRLRDQFLNRSALANLLAGTGVGSDRSATERPVIPIPPQFVLVIDEINRANISKVFGELITLIEPDKRLGMANALTVRLPYSRREFGVPANLHIVGTMNTADRSIALLDTALRRRFRFRELAPDTSVPAFLAAEAASGVPLRRVLNTINDRIEYLVDRDHRIGHAFFIGCDSLDAVNEVMRHKVIPLLQEYFFEDWGQLAAVLGDGGSKSGSGKGGFLAWRELKDPTRQGGEPHHSWSLLDPFGPDAYARLIGKGAHDEPATDENGAEECGEADFIVDGEE